MTTLALYSLDENNTVRFSMTNMSRKISGPEEAVQVVAKALFLEPGSNIFARQDGGGILSVLKGRNMGDLKEARADTVVAVRRAWETVKKNQGTGKPADESITSLDLVDLSVVADTQSWLVKIRISLEDGNTFSVNFEG